MRIGKTLALLLSCALLLTMFPSVEGYAVDRQSEPVSAVSDVALYANTGWQKRPTITVTSAASFPLSLGDGAVLQINGPIDYTAPAGRSPITVAANATVSIIINGSVTLHGANASGKTGATAAIKVPSSSKLYIYSAHDEELSVIPFVRFRFAPRHGHTAAIPVYALYLRHIPAHGFHPLQ